MGEYAEMMGTCCQTCGEYLGSDNSFPTSCASCSREERRDEYRAALYICKKPAAVAKLEGWLKGRPSFNIVDGDRKDRRGQPMVVVHYDDKPESDWGKIRAGSKSVIICTAETHKHALKIAQQNAKG